MKLGFDVVTAAVGGTVFKLGGKVVAHTASGAIQHYKQLHPVFAKLYDQAAKVIAKGVDKVRQLDARLDNIVHTATGRLTERLGRGQATSTLNATNVSTTQTKAKFETKSQTSTQIQSSTNINSGVAWTSWNNYPKVVDGGREYAKIGNRLYTRHAVDRMQPSGLGTSAGPTQGAGRNFPPNFVEEIIKHGTSRIESTNDISRNIFTLGDFEIVTEKLGKIVVTIKRIS